MLRCMWRCVRFRLALVLCLVCVHVGGFRAHVRMLSVVVFFVCVPVGRSGPVCPFPFLLSCSFAPSSLLSLFFRLFFFLSLSLFLASA